MERVARQDAERPWPEDVLEWTTRNGAAALGLGADCGSLEAGRKADLVIVDARRPHLVPALRIVSAFVHNGQAGDVVARAEAIAHRAWRDLVDRYPDVPFPIRLPGPPPR